MIWMSIGLIVVKLKKRKEREKDSRKLDYLVKRFPAAIWMVTTFTSGKQVATFHIVHNQLLKNNRLDD